MFWILQILQSAREGGIVGIQNITSLARKAGDFRRHYKLKTLAFVRKTGNGSREIGVGF